MSKDTKASSMLRYEIHRAIRRAGFESNVSVYEAIGALRICEHDLLQMLDLRSDNDTGEQLPDVMDEGQQVNMATFKVSRISRKARQRILDGLHRSSGSRDERTS